MLNALMLPASKFHVTEQDGFRRARVFDVEWIEADEAGTPAGDRRLPACPSCGQDRPHLAGRAETVEIVDAPAFGFQIRWRLHPVQAFKCQACGARSKLFPAEVDLDLRMTARCLTYVDRLAALRPFAHVAEEIGIPPHRVADVARALWATDAETYAFPIPRYLGIDEVALNRPGDKRRNPPKRTVFTDLDSGNVLDILESDSFGSVLAWLEGLQHEVDMRRKADPDATEKPWIRAVISDMKPEYRLAAEVALDAVPFVVDRFHVHQLFRAACRGFLEPKNHRKAARKVDTELDRMDGIVHEDDPNAPDLLREADEVQKAFDGFNAIYAQPGCSMAAAARMEEWADGLPSQIRERLSDFIDTLRRTPGLLDFFDVRVTNAKAEAANSIIRVAYQTDLEVYEADRELRRGRRGLTLLRAKMRARARHRPATKFYCDGCFKLKPLSDKHLSPTRMILDSFLAEETFDDEPYWLCGPCLEKAGEAETVDGFPLGRKWPSIEGHDLEGDEAEASGSLDLLAWARFDLTLNEEARYNLTPTRLRNEPKATSSDPQMKLDMGHE